MPFFIFFISRWAFSEEVELVTTTPVWVPITILLLILLIFVWGLTRGNVLDENRAGLDESVLENGRHIDPDAY